MYKIDNLKYKIISDLLDGSPNRLRENYFIKNNRDIYDEIIRYTSNISDIKFKFKVWHWVHNIPDYILCECGNRLSNHMNWMDGYKKFCSNKCSSNNKTTKENTKNTLLNRYGVDHYSKTKEYVDKVKKTSTYKYGVDNYSKTDDYVEKSKKTCMDRYGVDHYTKTIDYVEKSKKTCMDRYGVDSFSKTDKFKEKFKKTCVDKYGVDHIFKNNFYRDSNFNITKNEFYISYLDKLNLFNCDCGQNHNFKISTDDYFGRIKANNKLCTICYPVSSSSSIKETMLFKFIDCNYDGDIMSNYRDKYEIDIYLPELNIGFEFNGVYWHSEKFKSKNYHIDKTDYFKDKGIRIVHIWEDDWVNKENIIKSQILNLLNITKNRIFARKCHVKEISVKDTLDFLNENHIQGSVHSVIKLGLFYNDELVSIMTFDHFEGRKRINNDEWNLSRFCNKIEYNIIGGASKLLSNFIKNYNPIRIISYADKDWSIGSLYYKLGFENIGGNGPDYKYVINDKRIHKSRYRKSKLNTKLTESNQMMLNGILKIYDCGKMKFEMILKNA